MKCVRDGAGLPNNHVPQLAGARSDQRLPRGLREVTVQSPLCPLTMVACCAMLLLFVVVVEFIMIFSVVPAAGRAKNEKMHAHTHAHLSLIHI